VAKRATQRKGAHPLEDVPGIREIAELLARGILRLAAKGPSLGKTGGLPAETALNSASQGLAKPANSRLSVHRGVRPES
jgi:hypothetical protein